MLRFARLQLRNADAAEDLVQDAMELALRTAESFAGRSSLKTWIYAILRNRIIDYHRVAERMVSVSGLMETDDDWQERSAALFDERGAWRDEARPQAWADPEQALQQRQFWSAFEACLPHLSESAARVFTMRELLGLDVTEIALQLRLTPGNCHVILHRTRMRLRACLEAGWGSVTP